MGEITERPSLRPATRGRPFTKGNGGRRPGSRNRASLISAALLQGDKEGLLSKAVQLAKDGDVQMLKFLLSRSLPRERLIAVDLPELNFAEDGVQAIGYIMRAVCEAKISPSEGASLAIMVNSYTRAIDLADLVKRMEAVEARINGTA
jgi:hypothetical protein